jgi:ABC-type polysaccharide/polyol phosphate transport system ATPase subunit
VRDGDKGHLEGRGAARRARGVARSGLFVEVGSRYRLRRTERGSRSSGCGGSKKFSGVKAVDGVDLEILPGEVRMMAGENGAREYTSIKILSQVERPTEGEVGIPGERLTFYGPGYARSSGRAII